MLASLKNKVRYYEIVVYNKIILTKTYSLVRNFVLRHKYDRVVSNYEAVLQKVRAKAASGEKINVAFLFFKIRKTI